MPFTFSHPAIILPLRQLAPKYVSMTGLIIGSMLPDFEYFIRMNLKSEYSHTLWGVFYFCLPLGILLATLFHLVVRDTLIDHLPQTLHTRFAKYKGFDWISHFKSSWHILLLSLLIGTFSHILWDMFTHPTGFFVHLFPFLAGSISVFGTDILIFKILQQGSTLLGGLFILWFIYRLPQTDVEHRPSFSYWFQCFAVMAGIIAVRLLWQPTMQIGNLIVIHIAAFLLSLLLVSFYYKLKKTTSEYFR